MMKICSCAAVLITFWSWQLALLAEPVAGPGKQKEGVHGKKHPDELKGVRSVGGSAKTSISFLNRMTRPIKVYWIDYDGKRDTRPSSDRTLKPGATVGFNTTVKSPYVVTDEQDNAISVYYAEDKPRMVEIGSLVDYASPKREYNEGSKGQWRFMLEKSLMVEEPAIGEKAMSRLATALDKLLEILPTNSHEIIKKLKLYIMHGPQSPNGGRDNGLDYIRAKQPELFRSLDPKWNHAIVVYCAKNYCEISDLWATKATVHEIAHAFHLSNWPEDQPDIQKAYEHATKMGLYQKVKDSETGETIERAYAAANALEYFAELSACYFCRINYTPNDQEGLKSYDPVGYDMIEKMWRRSAPNR